MQNLGSWSTTQDNRCKGPGTEEAQNAIGTGEAGEEPQGNLEFQGCRSR